MTKKKKLIVITSSVLAALLVLIGIAAVVAAYFGCLVFIFPTARADEGQIRVACVGDSITYGNGIKNWFKNTYPAQLEDMLGDEYAVGNFGNSGRTAMNTGDFPYINYSPYGKSLKFKPQIVVIMLGTNDSKTQNWQGKGEYKRQYGELIDIYLSQSSVEMVFICTPPPIYEEKWNMQASIVDGDLNAAARELAEEKGLILVDTTTPLSGAPQLFSDNIHPNAQGAEVFARTVCDAIKANYIKAA